MSAAVAKNLDVTDIRNARYLSSLCGTGRDVSFMAVTERRTGLVTAIDFTTPECRSSCQLRFAHFSTWLRWMFAQAGITRDADEGRRPWRGQGRQAHRIWAREPTVPTPRINAHSVSLAGNAAGDDLSSVRRSGGAKCDGASGLKRDQLCCSKKSGVGKSHRRQSQDNADHEDQEHWPSEKAPALQPRSQRSDFLLYAFGLLSQSKAF